MANSLLLLLSLGLLASLAAAGNNGMALTPPLTWRSWNQYGWYITEDVILSAAAGLVDGSRPIKGRPAGTSLMDLGFDEVGMDEGWAACPASPDNHGRDPNYDPRARMPRQAVPKPFDIGNNRTSMMHRLNNKDGSTEPVVDELAFPDMSGLVRKIHAKGLRAGWYLNDCLSYCYSISDDCPPEQCIPGDVKAWHRYGFDSLKIDGCSAQHGTAMWADLLNKTGTKVRLENCNNGPKPSKPIAEGGCPYYHQYRTGGDITNAYASWMSNAQEVAQFATSGRHGPTCWAYPDMQMIGVQGQTPDEDKTGRYGPWAGGFVQPTITEQRTHFGLWCVLSAPLTLSLDFTNKSATDSVWPIITNTHALAVNQAWAGEPGTVFQQSSDRNVTLRNTCVFNTTCDNHGKGADPKVTLPAWQAWYKPLPQGGAAIFVANHDSAPAAVSIDFASVPGLSRGFPAAKPAKPAKPARSAKLSAPRPYRVVDVWKQEPLPGTHTSHTEPALAARDSVFITVHPA